MSHISRHDEPAGTALTLAEMEDLTQRGALRVFVERDPSAGGGVTAIAILLRRGEAPLNTMLFRITDQRKSHDDDGRTIPRRATLEQASPAKRAAILLKIGERVSERFADLPRNDNEPEDAP